MLRKLFWMIALFGAYVWIVTSGRDQMLLEQGKAFYKYVITWLEDADIDYNLKKEKSRKKSRRWE